MIMLELVITVSIDLLHTKCPTASLPSAFFIGVWLSKPWFRTCAAALSSTCTSAQSYQSPYTLHSSVDLEFQRRNIDAQPNLLTNSQRWGCLHFVVFVEEETWELRQTLDGQPPPCHMPMMGIKPGSQWWHGRDIPLNYPDPIFLDKAEAPLTKQILRLLCISLAEEPCRQVFSQSHSYNLGYLMFATTTLSTNFWKSNCLPLIIYILWNLRKLGIILRISVVHVEHWVYQHTDGILLLERNAL